MGLAVGASFRDAEEAGGAPVSVQLRGHVLVGGGLLGKGEVSPTEMAAADAAPAAFGFVSTPSAEAAADHARTKILASALVDFYAKQPLNSLPADRPRTTNEAVCVIQACSVESVRSAPLAKYGERLVTHAYRTEKERRRQANGGQDVYLGKRGSEEELVQRPQTAGVAGGEGWKWRRIVVCDVCVHVAPTAETHKNLPPGSWLCWVFVC